MKHSLHRLAWQWHTRATGLLGAPSTHPESVKPRTSPRECFAHVHAAGGEATAANDMARASPNRLGRTRLGPAARSPFAMRRIRAPRRTPALQEAERFQRPLRFLIASICSAHPQYACR